MTDSTTDARLRLVRLTQFGFAAALAAVVSLAGGAWWEMRQQDVATGWLGHTQEVRTAIARTRALLADVLGSHLTYVVSQRPSDAAAESAPRAALAQQITALRTLVADNPAQQARVSDLEAALAPWFASLQRIAVARGAGTTTDAEEAQDSDAARTPMTALGARLDAIDQDERSLLQARVAEHDARVRGVRLTIAGMVATLLVAVVALYSVIRRRHAEREELLISEQRFHVLARSVVDYGIFLLDRTGRVESWNMGAERIKGYREHEIVGKHFSIFYPPEDVAQGKPDRELITAAEEGRFQEEGWRVRKDGSRFWALVVITALRDEAGETTSFAKVTRDLTERKRSEDALLAEVAERRRIDAELQALNRSLETQVEARTGELRESNARLLDAKLHLQELSTRLIAAQEEERGRIARELHDTTGQSLTGIRMRLDIALRREDERVARINECIAVVDAAVKQVRRISLNLRPLMLDDLGLADALEWVLGEQAATAGWTTTMHADDYELRLPPDVETACFRIAQEALTNIARHAGAHNAEIRLQMKGGAFDLTIADDGKGFDKLQMQSSEMRRAHFGLVSMTERADLAGGRVEISSAPGQGTTVHVRFPLV